MHGRSEPGFTYSDWLASSHCPWIFNLAKAHLRLIAIGPASIYELIWTCEEFKPFHLSTDVHVNEEGKFVFAQLKQVLLT